ncbi:MULTISPECIES: acetolactate synthase small subunit [Maridesulfovibrio]|uniref:Acetolactate synthase small subunit n=1 Tax=Maridesulfovibrio salexigens (strain ATCC 14822 / DSM 2638 / NCIMB 8403 / VKM B-1763) TaxID=526222 RepID=C6BTQ2_MARSD|nr:acetolactate synthase small subunit [Maridesulfovibrio salexigens]ACS79832.1 acetolactate synthase, small subunit [Maridesulfovibrio salexigens DSM 2638]
MCKHNFVIDLLVRNHAGVMSQITGLFSRRNFNLEGIICGPVGDGGQSRMILTVADDSKLEQIMLQLEKLYDVLKVEQVEGHPLTEVLSQL